MNEFVPTIPAGLSEERFGAYRRATQGDDTSALALYEWNTVISAAWWADISRFEVLVRNAMHDRLTDWSIRTYGEPLWYRNPGRILTPRHMVHIAEARRRATTGARAKPETPGRIVAELPFGFWRYLLSSHYDRTLWKPVFIGTFGVQQRRKPVYYRLTVLNELRNRIAHHEPIHTQRLETLHNELLTVLDWIKPTYRKWVEQQSTVPELLASRPPKL
jgi:hypothetical protein